jgi:Uma2 family endonuclease
MAEQVAPASLPNLIQSSASTEGISADEYMARYAHDFYEWANGELVKMPPVSKKHDVLTGYFYKLLEAYLS